MKIKTTHVGSLPRPAEMLTRQLKKEVLTPGDLRHYTGEVVERQLALGLSVINNGEVPRSDYINATIQRISGFGGSGTAPIPRDMEELPEYARRFGGRNGLITLNPKAPVALPVCTSELQYTGESSLREELAVLRSVFDEGKARHPQNEATLFFTAPSPGTVALFLGNAHYPDHPSYLAKLGEVLRKEYDIILSQGMQLQIDCPDLAMGRHTAYRHLSDSAFMSIIEANVAVLNQALTGLDADRCRAHICWGNYAGTHHCDIELETILPAILKLHPRFISLESCNHRHAHEWEVFKRHPFPDNKVLLPGVIDTNSITVEHPDLVCRRLLDYIGILGPERVMGSTDCGFASTASAASVPGEAAWLKLESLVEGARRAESRI